MTGIEEYGVKGDERFQIAVYRAGYKAFRLMGVLSFVAFLALLAFGNEAGAMTVVGVSIAGGILYDYLMEKEGWEQFVQEELQHRPEVRKRAIRCEIQRGVVFAFAFGCIDYFILDPGSLIGAIVSGVILGALTTWITWRQRLRKQRSRPSVSS